MTKDEKKFTKRTSAKVRVLMAVALVITDVAVCAFGWMYYSDYKKNLDHLTTHGQFVVKMTAHALERPLWDLNMDQARSHIEALSLDQDFQKNNPV